MSKKITLLAVAAASVAALALPATAMAVETDVSVHAVGVELNKAQKMDGVGNATLTGPFNDNIICPVSSGTATFTSTTAGTLQLTFGENAVGSMCFVSAGGSVCTSPGQAAGVIKTEILPFHLVTVVDSTTFATGPGVLVTPNGGKFTSFQCVGSMLFNVEGNGLVGTIKGPECGQASNEATIQFNSSSNTVQTDKTVASEENGINKHTPTEYSLKAFGANASEDAESTITLGSKATLECT